MAETTTEPPAPLVPLVDAEDRADLIRDVSAALALEVKADPARDADRLTRSATTAVEAVEQYLDRTTSLDYATLPSTVFGALVAWAAADLRRPGFAMGVAAYDDADPMAVRTYGAIRAELQPYKERFGIA